MSKLNVIDLFAGVGGLSLGFNKEGFNVIYANEFDNQIAYTYKKNHPQTIVNNKDINFINIKRIENFNNKIDVVMGGPPCQGFSQK